MSPDPKENQKEELKMDLKDVIRTSTWVLKFLFKLEPLYLTLFLAARIVDDLRELANAYIFAIFLDQLITSAGSASTIQDAFPYLLAMIAVEASGGLFQFLKQYFSFSIAVRCNQLSFSKALYTKYKDLGIQNLEQPEINDRLNRASDGLNSLVNYTSLNVRIISILIRLVATGIILWTVNPLLILIAVLGKLPYFILDSRYRRISWNHIIKTTEARRMSYTTAADLMASNQLQEININGSFNYLDTKFTTYMLSFIKDRLKIILNWFSMSSIVATLGQIINLVFGFYLILINLISKSITIGTFTFQIRTLNVFSESMESLIDNVNEVNGQAYQIKDTYAMFNTKQAFSDGTVELPKLETGPEIEIKDMSFNYPGSEKLIFQNLNLNIKSGEKVAIVGHNGAGKTTLVRLICRFYQVTKGEILINKSTINDLKADSLYKNIGVLFQEFNRHLQLTARENIYLGDTSKPVDEIKIIEAAKSADAYSFIEELPEKFDQILSEKFKGGVKLSTGQWQKLAIARFFYRNSPLVIFDEPTAAIDAVSEYNIFNKIYEFFSGKTVIIISHRFSTVRNADRIIVVEHGEIIEEGTHRELMDKEGYYAKAFKLQAEGYQN